MKELQDIIRASRDLQRNGSPAVLATIVNVHGSTYRRPGARMLIAQEGRTFGLISGGCLEGDLFKRAGQVFASGQTELITYDTRSSDDLVWGFGLGCTGLIEVLLERIPSPDGTNHLEFLSRCMEGRRACVVSTILNSPPNSGLATGTRVMLDENGTVELPHMDEALSASILADCRSVLSTGGTRISSYELRSDQVRVFIEAVQPPPRLLVFGAGADAIPLIRLAKAIGWTATVIDNRPAYLKPELFPEADAVILADPGTLPEDAALLQGDIAVVMTHNYHHDLAIVRFLLPSPVRYIGLLGPRSKSVLLMNELASNGCMPTPEQLSRLYAPVGLDIGAETPEEIALAIIAEMQAASTDRSAGSLRNREGSIHR